MAIKLPKYQQQVSTSAESGAVRGDVGSAGSEWGAVGQFGKVATDLAVGLKQKVDKEKDDSDFAREYNAAKRRASAAQAEMGAMSDPEEIEKFYTAWETQERDLMGSLDVSDRVRSTLGPNVQNLWGTNRINADTFKTKAQINLSKHEWVKVQQDALDNIGFVNPETGEMMSPEQSHEYASERLWTIDPSYYEQGREDNRRFNSKLEYKKIVSIADNNPDEAQRLFDESTSLSPEQQVGATDVIRDAQERRTKTIRQTQEAGASKLNVGIKNGTLSREEIRIASEETETIMGKEVPVVSPEAIEAYRLQLDLKEAGDVGVMGGQMETFNDYVEAVSTVGSHWYNNYGVYGFSEDPGDPETAKMYTAIGRAAKNGASKSTVESMLNIANMATEDYANGRGWNFDSVSEIKEIADVFTTLYVEGSTRYKSTEAPMAIMEKTNSFIEFVQEKGGNPTREEIAEWRKLNMGQLDRDVALKKYSSTYRIGEKQRTPKGVRTYQGNGVFKYEGE
jgi:hypothetical protein